MDRLFKPQYLTVALIMVVCLALMTLVLPRFPDKVCTLPLWILIVSEYCFALGVSVCAQFNSLRKSLFALRITPALISTGVAFLIAAIGVPFSPINAWGPDGSIAVGLVQLTVLNLAILFSIFTLTGEEQPVSEETLSQEESSAANTTNIKRLTQIRVKAIHSKGTDEDEPNMDLEAIPALPESSSSLDLQELNDPGLQNFKQASQSFAGSPLQGLVNRTTLKTNIDDSKSPSQPTVQKTKQSSTMQAVDISTVEKLLIPPGSASSQNQMPVAKQVPSELKRLPSANPSKIQNKIDQIKKPVSGTISKLQGLSASGTGAAHITRQGVDNSDLKSVLDRLDDTEDATSEELVREKASVKEEFVAPPAQEGMVFRQPVDKEVDSIFDKITTDSKPEMSKSGATTESKLASPRAGKIEPGVFQNKVDDDVEDIFSGMVSAEAQREVSKSESVLKSSPANQDLDLAPSANAATGGSLFAQPIDKEMDSIFDKIAPEAKPEIGKGISPQTSTMDSSIESKFDSGVFKKKVDSEVEEIFSGMVSPEAQREVARTDASFTPSRLPSQIQAPGANAASGGSLFAQPIDKEMDSIFDKIAPEAKPEIAKSESKQTNTIIDQPIESKLDSGVFKKKVDDDVEDIFSGMVSPEAQKEVPSSKSAGLQKPNVSDSEITGDRSSVLASFDASASDHTNAIPELKDFGRLSSRASAEKESANQAGTMKTIGKLLIDSEAVENIIKKADSGKITINLPSAKVISQIRGQGIQNLLNAIDSFDGVEGSMLVGEDGLVILSTLSGVSDRDGTGVLAHGMLGNSNIGTQKLDLGELEQMILISTAKEGKNSRQLTTVCTDVEAGVLAVFLELKTLSGLDNLLEKIDAIANG